MIQQGPLPVQTPQIASLPKEERRSASRLSKFIWAQYQQALSRRKWHAISWVMIQSYLRGIHYFTIDLTGQWAPLPPKPDEVRGVVPVIKPMVNHLLGFMNANEPGVTTKAVTGEVDALNAADRAYNILTHWIEETGFDCVAHRGNRVLLTEGMGGYYYYLDRFCQNVKTRFLPGSELFPVPYDARGPEDISHLIHASVVTKGWLEQQDAEMERMLGHSNFPKMADEAGKRTVSMHIDAPNVGTTSSGTSDEGSVVLSVWGKKTPTNPYGEYMFFVGEKLFRYSTDPEILSTVIPNGEIPVEIVYFAKEEHDFWGYGLAELLIPTQRTQDRMMTILEKSAKENQTMTWVDTRGTSINDIQDSVTSYIPFDGSQFEHGSSMPAIRLPGSAVSRDVLVAIEAARSLGDQAVGMRSGLSFGMAEGRVETGPAVNQLLQMSMATLTPVTKEIVRGQKRLYPKVLDMLPAAWPDQKTIRVSGKNNLGREIQLARTDIPTSQKVIISPVPMLPGGTQSLLAMLFEMRRLPGPDGINGSEVSSREFRDSLREMKMLPPGFDMADKAESRIRTRINLLINDGKQPAVQPASPKDPQHRLIMEDHRLAMEMFKEVILDDMFETYGPAVQQALLSEARFHLVNTHGATSHPNDFDDDIERLEALQAENTLAFAESNLDTYEGEIPV